MAWRFHAGCNADDRRSALIHGAPMNNAAARPHPYAPHLLSAAEQGDCTHRALARALPEGGMHNPRQRPILDCSVCVPFAPRAPAR
ncbi:hypothetical protein XavaCFBP5823_06840 [Xanthomonas axonopodis pv. vasculorum]|nr:hypothetical protein XavaCFBP5823_06840 [Xanthomonas axonopodis pv. vasculorum]